MRDKVRVIAELTGQVLWSLTPDGELTDDSPSWRAHTGQTFDQARGRGWMDTVHPEDRPAVETAWREAWAHRRPCEIECRIQRPHDRYTRARMRGMPVFDPAGQLSEWIATSSEVWADETVRRSEERLRLATEAGEAPG